MSIPKRKPPKCHICKNFGSAEHNKMGQLIIHEDPHKKFKFIRYVCATAGCLNKRQTIGDAVI